MVMSELVSQTPVQDEEPNVLHLDEARRLVERVATDAALTRADRAALGQIAVRLGAVAGVLREAAKPKPPTDAPTLKLPARVYTRKEAARLLKVHPNTLVNWEAAGTLVPKRDAKGWRVYTAAHLQRGLAILAHVPVDDLPDAD